MKVRLYTFLFSICFSIIGYSADVTSYHMVVDAGSSGSRLHIFSYTTHASGLPDIQEVYSKNIKPGLSGQANTPNPAPVYMKPLLDAANTFLTQNNIDPETVSIDILGTAGMRLLNQNTQNQIYGDLRSFIQKHYAFRSQSIETISGHMEGVYGWLDVNYLSGALARHEPTLGIVDMGGMSVELAYNYNRPLLRNDGRG